MSCTAGYDRDKWQTRPLVREGAPHRQNRNCLTVTNIWSWAPDGAWHQDWLAEWPSVVMWLWLWLKIRCNKRSASTERPTPPLVGEEAPFLKHVFVYERKRSLVKCLYETCSQEEVCWRGPTAILPTDRPETEGVGLSCCTTPRAVRE
jgi:hypothetical protein